MTTPEVAGAVIAALSGMGLTAIAKGWLVVSLSVRVIPPGKRQPRTAVEVVQIVPGTVEPDAEVKKITTARGQAS